MKKKITSHMTLISNDPWLPADRVSMSTAEDNNENETTGMDNLGGRITLCNIAKNLPTEEDGGNNDCHDS